MEDRNTLLFYILCVAALVILTGLYTTQEDLAEISVLPATPPQARSTPTATPVPP